MATWDEIRTTPVQNKWRQIRNIGVGSNTSNIQKDPNPQFTQKITDKFNKYSTPTLSLLSPLEVGIDSGIRTATDVIRGNTKLSDIKSNFLKNTYERGKAGSDIGGALEYTKLPLISNPLLAQPVGFMASVALPGLGEVSQGRNAAKVAGNSIDSATRAVRTRLPKVELNAAIDLLSQKKPSIDDYNKAQESIKFLGQKILGENETFKILNKRRVSLEKKYYEIADKVRKVLDKKAKDIVEDVEIPNFINSSIKK